MLAEVSFRIELLFAVSKTQQMSNIRFACAGWSNNDRLDIRYERRVGISTSLLGGFGALRFLSLLDGLQNVRGSKATRHLVAWIDNLARQTLCKMLPVKKRVPEVHLAFTIWQVLVDSSRGISIAEEHLMEPLRQRNIRQYQASNRFQHRFKVVLPSASSEQQIDLAINISLASCYSLSILAISKRVKLELDATLLIKIASAISNLTALVVCDLMNLSSPHSDHTQSLSLGQGFSSVTGRVGRRWLNCKEENDVILSKRIPLSANTLTESSNIKRHFSAHH
ncbi:hypothetical protein HG530_014123 [Fusarium avenaceum]|nr:hypothetical protein HG530_014123 [Fusarium avenaceum]